MFKDYPVTGVGLGAFIMELPNYYEKTNSEIRHVDFSGNYYLQILSELGLIGLFLILFIFFMVIKKAFIYYKNIKKLKKFSSDDWLLGGFFISFMSMVFILFLGPHTNFNEIQFTFWLIIGLIFSYISIKENNIVKEAVTASINNAAGLEADLNLLNTKNENDFLLEAPAFPVIKKIFNKKSVILADRIHFNLGQSISFIAVILIFSSLFFTASWYKLSINNEQIIYGWENVYGFNKVESYQKVKMRWIGPDASEVINKKSSVMMIPIRDVIPAEYYTPLYVKIFVDNYLVKKVKLDYDKWQEVEIRIPNFARDKFTLTFSLSRTWIPKEVKLNNDTRELGVMIGKYQFR